MSPLTLSSVLRLLSTKDSQRRRRQFIHSQHGETTVPTWIDQILLFLCIEIWKCQNKLGFLKEHVWKGWRARSNWSWRRRRRRLASLSPMFLTNSLTHSWTTLHAFVPGTYVDPIKVMRGSENLIPFILLFLISIHIFYFPLESPFWSLPYSLQNMEKRRNATIVADEDKGTTEQWASEGIKQQKFIFVWGIM